MLTEKSIVYVYDEKNNNKMKKEKIVREVREMRLLCFESIITSLPCRWAFLLAVATRLISKSKYLNFIYVLIHNTRNIPSSIFHSIIFEPTREAKVKEKFLVRVLPKLGHDGLTGKERVTENCVLWWE